MTDSESKRTEYLWDQMSVMERCEVLRSEVKELRLKQIASRIKTYPMSDGERLDDLARRVAEIELGLSASTPTGAHICPMELARLRRVEEAARRVYSWNWQYTAGIDRQAERDLESLRAALDSEPKR